MPSLAEIRRALMGAWRLLRLDAKALAYFDPSPAGALRSFWVALVVVPLYVAGNSIPRPPSDAPLPPHNIAIDVIGFMASWPLMLLVIYGLVRWYGRADRFLLYVTASNWGQILQSLAMLAVVALFAGAGMLVNLSAPETASAPQAILGALAAIIAMALFISVFAYEWYVAWVSLEAGLALPIIVVLLDIVTGVALDRLSAALA